MSFTLRAEELSVSKLDAIKPIFGTYYIDYLADFLSSKGGKPLFLLGRKGSGKTFTVLKAIRKMSENSNILYLAYKKNKTLRAFFGYNLQSTPNTSLEGYEAICVDDIHFMCEDIASGQYNPKDFISLLMNLCSEMNKGTKIILISEDLLLGYTLNLHLEKASWALSKLGHPMDRARIYETDDLAIAFKEIMLPLPVEWVSLFSIYGVNASLDVMALLYNCNRTPRGFLKFMNLFSSNIEMADVFNIGLKRFHKDYNFDENTMNFMMKYPSLSLDHFEICNEYLSKLSGSFEGNLKYMLFLQSHIDTIDRICLKAVSKLIILYPNVRRTLNSVERGYYRDKKGYSAENVESIFGGLSELDLVKVEKKNELITVKRTEKRLLSPDELVYIFGYPKSWSYYQDFSSIKNMILNECQDDPEVVLRRLYKLDKLFTIEIINNSIKEEREKGITLEDIYHYINNPLLRRILPNSKHILLFAGLKISELNTYLHNYVECEFQYPKNPIYKYQFPKFMYEYYSDYLNESPSMEIIEKIIEGDNEPLRDAFGGKICIE